MVKINPKTQMCLFSLRMFFHTSAVSDTIFYLVRGDDTWLNAYVLQSYNETALRKYAETVYVYGSWGEMSLCVVC